mgnify:CR=1 FL=1
MKIILDVENTTTKRNGKLHLDPFEPDNSLTLVGVQDCMAEDNTIFVFDHKEKTIEDDSAQTTQTKKYRLFLTRQLY